MEEDKSLTKNGGEWKTYNILRKYATGTARHGDIIDLRNYSNGVPWKNSQMCVGLKEITLHEDSILIRTEAVKLDENRYEIHCYSQRITKGEIINKKYNTSTHKDYTYSTEPHNTFVCNMGSFCLLNIRGVDKYGSASSEVDYKHIDENENILSNGKILSAKIEGRKKQKLYKGGSKIINYNNPNVKSYITISANQDVDRNRYGTVNSNLLVSTSYDNTNEITINEIIYTGEVEFIAYEK